MLTVSLIAFFINSKNWNRPLPRENKKRNLQRLVICHFASLVFIITCMTLNIFTEHLSKGILFTFFIPASLDILNIVLCSVHLSAIEREEASEEKQ